jgi:hypothetical protein
MGRVVIDNEPTHSVANCHQNRCQHDALGTMHARELSTRIQRL